MNIVYLQDPVFLALFAELSAGFLAAAFPFSQVELAVNERDDQAAETTSACSVSMESPLIHRVHILHLDTKPEIRREFIITQTSSLFF